MTFDELLTLAHSQNAPAIRTDSRQLKTGDIFIAIKGANFDGHSFIKQAIDNGTGYIVAENIPTKIIDTKNIKIITVNNSAKAAAFLAQAQRQNPASKLINFAVTGTNGKTTIAYLLRSIINNSGQKCGIIGTIIYDTGDKITPAKLTTPDSFTIASLTEKMVKAGAKYMITEASSHALHQDRLEAINFKAAAFTNLSGDHLDYHKTKDAYLAAKTKLFETLSPTSIAILNKQSPEAEQIAEKTNAKILWYAIDEPADITAHINSMDITGTTFDLKITDHRHTIKTPLLGKYNVSNCLAAAGLACAAGFDLKTIADGITALKAIPGRLQKIDQIADFTVIIDYAHTDDALKNILESLKPLCKKNLIVVFGCGGDRDKTKRPRMAKVAQKLADRIFVTSDNPRTENPNSIIDDILTGFEKPTDKTITVEPDRKKAIQMAIESAQKDDIIIIAGKGHETYQILADRTIDFSDESVAKEYLQKKNEKTYCKTTG